MYILKGFQKQDQKYSKERTHAKYYLVLIFSLVFLLQGCKPFAVTEVSQVYDYSVVYLKINSINSDSPVVLSKETVWAIGEDGTKYELKGVAPAGKIVTAISVLEIERDENGNVSLGIPGGDVTLLFALPRNLEEFEIAVAFSAKSEDLTSLEINGVRLGLP